MKWKRSKKAQQEAKEKKSASSSSSSSSSLSSNTGHGAAAISHSSSNSTAATTHSSNGNGNDHHSPNKMPNAGDKLLDANLLLTAHPNSFNVQKTMSSMDPHRHIVNLSSNLTEYSGNLDDSNLHHGAKMARRPPMIFADGNQNGDMFRPYVV